jgi:hypothetical protein
MSWTPVSRPVCNPVLGRPLQQELLHIDNREDELCLGARLLRSLQQSGYPSVGSRMGNGNQRYQALVAGRSQQVPIQGTNGGRRNPPCIVTWTMERRNNSVCGFFNVKVG